MYGSSEPENYDVVIIGAGLYGIQAARCYLEIHPEANLCILESDSVVGGTWSSSTYLPTWNNSSYLQAYLERVYDAFWTQTPVGMAEFSDRPMTPPPPEDQYYGFFPARYVTEYIESYVDDHTYNNITLRNRIRFNVRVEGIEKVVDRWLISCHGYLEMRAAQLIDATGMTSIPNIPLLPGQEDFQGKLLHHKDFAQLGDLKDVQGRRLAVLGGGKSAADVAYAAAKAGKVVSWIIREEGGGPAAFLSAKGRGPYANSNESFYTRFVASFLPNPFSKESYLSRFLHGTRLGSWIVRGLWDAIDKDHRRKVNYRREEGKGNNFDKLEPDTPIFWQNDSSGINQRPDFYSTIATEVYIYRQDIDHIAANSISLAAELYGEGKARIVAADVLVLCTGWSPISPIFSKALAEMMGLPVQLDRADEIEKRSEGEKVETRDIPDPFLSLRSPPMCRGTKPSHTPFRLYKAMVPEIDLNARSIVFLGKIVVGNNFRAAEVQALWAVAYLDGRLELEGSTIRQEINETVAWCRRRYLNKGNLGSWFFFDVLDYTDMVLAQLGLKSHRQNGWLKDFFGPCRAADLKDLIKEYRALYPP